MVDVTAQETGTKKVTVVLDAGRYKLTRPTDYLLTVGTPMLPFPLGVPGPLDDAYIVPYSGTPEEVPINVGPVYQLAALQSPPGYQQVVFIPPQPVPVDDWSFAIWFRRRDNSGGLIWFSDYEEPAWYAKFYNGALSSIVAQVAGEPTPASAPLSYPDNDYTWHMAVMVHDWTGVHTLALYIDGALIDTKTSFAPKQIQYGGNFVVGKDALPPDAQCQATGAAWMRALTPTEVATLWSSTSFPP